MNYIQAVANINFSVDYTSPEELGKLLNQVWKLKLDLFENGFEIDLFENGFEKAAKFSDKWFMLYGLHSFMDDEVYSIIHKAMGFLTSLAQKERENFLWTLGKIAGNNLNETSRFDVDSIAYMAEQYGITSELTAFGLLMNRPWPEFEQFFDNEEKDE